ncbi:Vga family ABC-F type ribosomal protection protein [Sporolactobacillus shoreae]|uniref:Vga family ABC-F type ribosomal protection protein n=1 Tax=Sporolactobacillus shoreae TaxID=1465501 RepID=A0A4Z0GR84_9BACL|nr:Vga family ABC-F type ribosomal protection protein [Sporolactobacillus shoreae]TGA98956.1 Vga family ABC-F type ribosomal protection protein [Sporolactobacillus shoreae]
MILLEALHVKHYVKDRLLLDVDQLRIHQRDRIGLVGRNGCGKTTLLNIFAEKMVPEEGTVIQRTQCKLLPQLKRTDTTKSGGEVTQEYIQKALVSNPELLLADEPTTNLDTDHIEWLERKLSEWQGAFVIVSHDRTFLDMLCTTIWEISESKIKVYQGNYSDYAAQKEIERREQQSAYESYEKKKQQLEEALKLKERKAQRATKKPKNLSSSEARIKDLSKKQKKLYETANAIETRLEKLEKVEKVKELQPLRMNLPNAETFKNRTILRAEDVSGRVGERILWRKTSFLVRGGDKLAIIGPNGSGKTTLIKKVINQEVGIMASPSMKIGYFSQNLNILDQEKSIIENVRATSKQDETLMRTVLARMHFFKDDVSKRVRVLSGGERVKVALSKVFLSDMNTLILDEPTNYLDMEAVGALESLLKEYEGSVLFVSHDRRFIENIATRILEIRNQTIRVFEGTYRQWKHDKPKKSHDDEKEKRLLLETKITEVLSRLSIEPSEELEQEFQRLLKEKKKNGQ